MTAMALWQQRLSPFLTVAFWPCKSLQPSPLSSALASASVTTGLPTTALLQPSPAKTTEALAVPPRVPMPLSMAMLPVPLGAGTPLPQDAAQRSDFLADVLSRLSASGRALAQR